MAKIIKLTILEKSSKVYVNVDNISYFLPTHKGTAINFMKDTPLWVVETPGQIIELINKDE